jgi:hypothetical protein
LSWQLDTAKLLPDLTVKLLGTVKSEDTIVKLMLPLADAMSQHWLHLGFGEGRDFVELTCAMPILPGVLSCSHGRGRCEFRIRGTLRGGQPDNGAGIVDQTGFTLKVESQLCFADGTQEQTDFRYVQAYPCLATLGRRRAVVRYERL